MPILDIGYRRWAGTRLPAWTRSWVVATTGVSLVWRGAWMRRLLLLLTFPSVIAAIVVGAFEQSLAEQATPTALGVLGEGLKQRIVDAVGADRSILNGDSQHIRHLVWSYVLFALFRHPQAFGMILLIGLVAPRLISFDLRSRGYLLYLSRPLTPAEYVLGKAGVLHVIVILPVTLPALAIYLVGLFLSTNSLAILETWDIPLRILTASIVLILPTSAIALALSSLVLESRFAGSIWFSMWLFGQVVYRSLLAAENIQNRYDGVTWDDGGYSRFLYLSPYELLGYMQRKVFGLLPSDTPLWLPLIAIVSITVVGYGIAYWRVVRTLKA